MSHPRGQAQTIASTIIIFASWIIQTRTGLITKSTVGETRSLATVGSSVVLANADLRRTPFSLVIVGSPSCVFCNRSISFHNELVADAARAGIDSYLVVPSRRLAQSYARSIGIDASRVREWRDLDLSVPGTPTILAVNSNGIVSRVWVGHLPSNVEGEIRSAISARSLTQEADGRVLSGTENLSPEKFQQLSSRGKTQIIELGERMQRRRLPSRGVEMPSIEIPVRAPFELDTSALQIVDCSRVSAVECQNSVKTLMRLHFQVATLGLGSTYNSCQFTEPASGL